MYSDLVRLGDTFAVAGDDQSNYFYDWVQGPGAFQ